MFKFKGCSVSAFRSRCDQYATDWGITAGQGPYKEGPNIKLKGTGSQNSLLSHCKQQNTEEQKYNLYERTCTLSFSSYEVILN